MALTTVLEKFPNNQSTSTRWPKNFEKLFFIGENCCFSKCSCVPENKSVLTTVPKILRQKFKYFLLRSRNGLEHQNCSEIYQIGVLETRKPVFRTVQERVCQKLTKVPLSPKMITKIMFSSKLLFLSGMDFCTCRLRFWQLGRTIWPKCEKWRLEVRKNKKKVWEIQFLSKYPLYA